MGSGTEFLVDSIGMLFDKHYIWKKEVKKEKIIKYRIGLKYNYSTRAPKDQSKLIRYSPRPLSWHNFSVTIATRADWELHHTWSCTSSGTSSVSVSLIIGADRTASSAKGFGKLIATEEDFSDSPTYAIYPLIQARKSLGAKILPENPETSKSEIDEL